MNETVEGRASRRGRTWVVHVPQYGVYGHGRTLKAARNNTAQGLALVGVSTEVMLIPVTPELEKLRTVEEAYTAALIEAVAALALRRTTLSDIALATGVTTKRVKQLLAQQADLPPSADLSSVEDAD